MVRQKAGPVNGFTGVVSLDVVRCDREGGAPRPAWRRKASVGPLATRSAPEMRTRLQLHAELQGGGSPRASANA